jgi:hypothetical protein
LNKRPQGDNFIYEKFKKAAFVKPYVDSFEFNGFAVDAGDAPEPHRHDRSGERLKRRIAHSAG